MSVFPPPSGNDNYTGIAARDTANSLRVLAGAVRGVAAGTKNPRTQEYILTTAQTVSSTTTTLASSLRDPSLSLSPAGR